MMILQHLKVSIFKNFIGILSGDKILKKVDFLKVFATFQNFIRILFGDKIPNSL